MKTKKINIKTNLNPLLICSLIHGLADDDPKRVAEILKVISNEELCEVAGVCAKHLPEIYAKIAERHFEILQGSM